MPTINDIIAAIAMVYLDFYPFCFSTYNSKTSPAKTPTINIRGRYQISIVSATSTFSPLVLKNLYSHIPYATARIPTAH